MKRLGCSLFALALIIAVGLGFYFYYEWTKPSTFFTESAKSLFVYPDDDFNSLHEKLKKDSMIEGRGEFKRIAELMSFTTESLKIGHYSIKKGTSYRSLINLLKSGNESPINLTYTNIRTIDEFTALLGEKLLSPAADFQKAIDNESTARNLSPENRLTMFLPDTYEVYWSNSGDEIISRLASETDKFWKQNNRTKKAKKQDLTPEEAYTLASIVQKESNDAEEKPIIASLYLNRLKIGMPLQADPTVIFANQDFTIRRVLDKHLAKDSPYNTYMYKGLPPGPICMPMKASIDAVLDPAETDYIFMCLRPSENGGHVFSSSDKEHIKNANKYHQWLDSRNIKK